MAEEVVLMNPDDEGNVKFDLLASQNAYIIKSDKNIFDHTILGRCTPITIKEITLEEADRRRALGGRVTNAGVRARYQDLWDQHTINGKIVYTDQVIGILHKVGGFSFRQAELIRKDIAKKRDLVVYKKLFHCNLTGGFQDEEIEDMWKQIMLAGEYCFNYSHYLVYHRQGMCPDICPICMYGEKKDG